jgi:hypothetical protein
MVGTSERRFDAGPSTRPIVQFVAMTIPFFALLVYFLVSTFLRPRSVCYSDDAQVTEEARVSACSKLIPLKQFAIVYLVVEFVWLLLSIYLSFYIPRRHNLIQAYLSQGETVIGDVYFKKTMRSLASLTFQGHLVYALPDSTMIRRKVVLFQRYTRERVAILCLPGLSFSGQPRADLEIDRDVIERNRDRLEILFYYSWAWVVFSAVAPLYIVQVMKSISAAEEGGGASWKPDSDRGSFAPWFYATAFIIAPGVAFLSNWVAWLYYKHWMTAQHTVLKEGEPHNAGIRGCCFDDDDCETIDIASYTPPSPNSKQVELQNTLVARC